MKEYAIWLGMTQVITSQREINNWTRNMKFNLEYSERFYIQAILDTINQLPWHLITFGTCWPQELPVEHTVVAINDKNTWEK